MGCATGWVPRFPLEFAVAHLQDLDGDGDILPSMANNRHAPGRSRRRGPASGVVFPSAPTRGGCAGRRCGCSTCPEARSAGGRPCATGRRERAEPSGVCSLNPSESQALALGWTARFSAACPPKSPRERFARRSPCGASSSSTTKRRWRSRYGGPARQIAGLSLEGAGVRGAREATLVSSGSASSSPRS